MPSQTIQGRTGDGHLKDIRVNPDGSIAYPTIAVTKFDPSEATPTYIGTNVNKSALDGDATWSILKFTRNGSAEVTQVQQATGSWTNRAGLTYG